MRVLRNMLAAIALTAALAPSASGQDEPSCDLGTYLVTFAVNGNGVVAGFSQMPFAACKDGLSGADILRFRLEAFVEHRKQNKGLTLDQVVVIGALPLAGRVQGDGRAAGKMPAPDSKENEFRM